MNEHEIEASIERHGGIVVLVLGVAAIAVGFHWSWNSFAMRAVELQSLSIGVGFYLGAAIAAVGLTIAIAGYQIIEGAGERVERRRRRERRRQKWRASEGGAA